MGNNLVDEYLNSIENEEEKQKIIELISNNKDLQSLLKVMCDDRTINYDDTKDFDINKINEHCKKYPNDAILVIIPNTKGITSDMLKNLNNHVYIRVEGAYDLTRIGALNQANFFNHKNRVTSAINLFFSSVIYTKDEAIKILEEIENIESKIKNKWSNFQKLVYLYTTLKTKITYDPEYEDSPNSEVRSLRGLITKKAVCAGYSLIFKEFCDRQNIKCYYVGGNGHAWNIVVIEGKHYAVDLTLENTKFRHGTHDSYIYLGQSPAEFNKTHKPYKNDPFRSLHSRICKLSRDALKFISSTVIKEEEFEKISFRCQRQNNTEFVLIQIGTKTINNEVYYTYYYDNMVDGKLNNFPLILTSKENISEYVDNKNFKKENIITSGDIINKVFSVENIADSLNKGSSYVGELVSYQGTKGYINQLRKEEKDLKIFNESPKVYPKNDGTVLVVEKDGTDPIKIGDTQAYKYNVYDVQYKENKPLLRKRIIYSDNDIIYSTKKEIQEKLLNEDNISYSIENNCGYIGYINETGNIDYNEELMKYFHSTEGITLDSLEKTKRR